MLACKIKDEIAEYSDKRTYYQLCKLNKYLNNILKNNWKIIA
jgi:hypothetical protein